ncbi:nuclease-related domain-containing protein [Alteribacillus bidgolensis]|uniref:nuclease-related domain-containing protein n=1 Tax=Alteribacillus bidgolensis TaxID=930129 RepID=UPI000B89804B
MRDIEANRQSIDYYLSSLSKKTDLIFHDIRLPSKDKTFFQIDIFILTMNFCLILEVKNVAGTLYFNPFFHQLIRTVNDKEEGFPDPILQINRQKDHLNTWLQKNNLPNLPIQICSNHLPLSHPIYKQAFIVRNAFIYPFKRKREAGSARFVQQNLRILISLHS